MGEAKARGTYEDRKKHPKPVKLYPAPKHPRGRVIVPIPRQFVRGK